MSIPNNKFYLVAFNFLFTVLSNKAFKVIAFGNCIHAVHNKNLLNIYLNPKPLPVTHRGNAPCFKNALNSTTLEGVDLPRPALNCLTGPKLEFGHWPCCYTDDRAIDIDRIFGPSVINCR